MIDSYIRAIVLENCKQSYPYLTFLMPFMLFQILNKVCSSFCFISLSVSLPLTHRIYQETVHKMNCVVENVFICKERKWQCPTPIEQLP